MKQLFHYYKLFTLLMLLSSNLLFAEGSKDLYPLGVEGLRGLIRDDTPHYVYAEAGETITLASSASNIGDTPGLTMYRPDGTQVIFSYTAGEGRINNRAAELAGPLLIGEMPNVTDKYKPLYYTVQPGEKGIFRVIFNRRAFTNPAPLATQNLADGEWTWENSTVAAWDISVINTANNAFIKGRVYMNGLSLSVRSTLYSPHPNPFPGIHGTTYIRTNDGYTYRIGWNGMNGLDFVFFSNNKGLLERATGAAAYRSARGNQVAWSTTSGSSTQYTLHSYNIADTDDYVTHKIFYNLPDPNLPESSIGMVPGVNATGANNTTWLNNTSALVYLISNLQLTGYSTSKNIEFDTNAPPSNYKITISSPTNAFPPVELTGISSANHNSIPWNSRDDNGNPVPPGQLKIEVELENVLAGEVHFPMSDVEYNADGFILELLNPNDLSQAYSDIIYWDDSHMGKTFLGSVPDPLSNSHLSGGNGTHSSIEPEKRGWGGGLATSGNTNNQTRGTLGDAAWVDTWAFTSNSTVSNDTFGEIYPIDAPLGDYDNDGIPNYLDLDNDNDGILDTDECPPVSNYHWSTPPAISGNTATGSIGGINYTYSYTDSSNGNILTTAVVYGYSNFPAQYGVPNQNPTIANHYVSNNKITFAQPMKNPVLVFSSIGNGNKNVSIEFNHPIEVLWTNGSRVTINSPTRITGREGYAIVQYTGTFSEIEFDYLDDESWVNFVFGADMSTVSFCDTDGDGIPDYLDLDSDNDGCLDALEGGKNISVSDLVDAGGTLSAGTGSSADNRNLCAGTSCVDSNGVPLIVSGGQSRNTAYDPLTRSGGCYCTKPGNTDAATAFTKVGILTKRSITSTGWPENVPNGHIVMDSHNKGFVITHMNNTQRDALTPLDGMLIYNTDEGCVQLYRGAAPGVDIGITGWNCIERGCNEY